MAKNSRATDFATDDRIPDRQFSSRRRTLSRDRELSLSLALLDSSHPIGTEN